jgi:hypothetical protein
MSDQLLAHTSIYLLTGMKAMIRIPLNVDDNRAMYPTERTTYRHNGVEYTLINGFFVVNAAVGEIERKLTNDEGFGVLYWHKKPESNTIIYLTEDPRIQAICSVMSVPIHDHSSIVQGGPAFGSYFSSED